MADPVVTAIGGAVMVWVWLRMKPFSSVQRRAGRQNTAFSKDTLIPLLHSHMIPMEQLEADYPAITSIVRYMIGIVPRCDCYLEIWPTAFKTYNLVVPNFMNAPFNQVCIGPGWGKGSALAGLATYVVSRTAECPYCSAHTCSYALRRGTSPKAVIAGFDGNESALQQLSEAESATIAVAKALGRVPCELTSATRERFMQAVGEKTGECIVFSAIAMGYLNKVMDSLGVELEEEAYLDSRGLIATDYAASKVGSMLNDARSKESHVPPKDSLWRKLSILSLVPGALMYEAQHTRGVPSTWPEVAAYLKTHTNYSFPILSTLSSSFQGKRYVVALATAFRENLNSTTVVSLPIKTMAAVIFARHTAGPAPDSGDASSSSLVKDARDLAAAHGVTPDLLSACHDIATGPVRTTVTASELPPALLVLGPEAVAYLVLSRAIAPSPAQVSEALVECLQSQGVRAEGVVEIVNFVALWQLLLRLDAFFPRGSTSGPLQSQVA